MGIERNVYGELLAGLQSENQKLLLTKLNEDGTLEKHIYQPGAEPETAEALAQQAAFEKKVCISGFGRMSIPNNGSRSHSARKTAC